MRFKIGDVVRTTQDEWFGKKGTHARITRKRPDLVITILEGKHKGREVQIVYDNEFMDIEPANGLWRAWGAICGSK